MEVSSQYDASAALLQGRQTLVVHCIRFWTGLRAATDILEKKKSLVLAGNRTPALHSIARSYTIAHRLGI
jgi:hypothetical protein